MTSIQSLIDEVREQEIDSLAKIAPLRSKSITEHGAGNGFVSNVLRSKYEAEVVALDPSPRDPQVSPVAQGRLQDNPAETDIVLTVHVLEHVPVSEWQNLVPLERDGIGGEIGIHVVPTVFNSLATTLLAPIAYFRNLSKNAQNLFAAFSAKPVQARLVLRYVERLMPYNVIRWQGHGTCLTPLHEILFWRRSYYVALLEKKGFAVTIMPLAHVYSMHRLFPGRFRAFRAAVSKCGMTSSMVILLRDATPPSQPPTTSQ